MLSLAVGSYFHNFTNWDIIVSIVPSQIESPTGFPHLLSGFDLEKKSRFAKKPVQSEEKSSPQMIFF